jgi:hypothetical protein
MEYWSDGALECFFAEGDDQSPVTLLGLSFQLRPIIPFSHVDNSRLH